MKTDEFNGTSAASVFSAFSGQKENTKRKTGIERRLKNDKDREKESKDEEKDMNRAEEREY